MIYELNPTYKTKMVLHHLRSFLSRAITDPRFRFTGFELMYYVLGNRIHFSILKMLIFPPSLKIMVSIIQFLIPKQRKITFSLLLLKIISLSIYIYDNSFIAVACTLKLKAINPSYLKNYVSGKTFMKLTCMQIQ